ncbi:MAG: FAD-dependent oxidoreductase [Cyanobacteria bacterium P01_F01_bin.33]
MQHLLSAIGLSTNISRRTFLQLAGFSAIGGGLGYSRYSKPKPTVHEQDGLDLPRYVSRPSSAVVVGGGLAGLACAYELAQRGVKVTLLEKSPQLGGKIASWPIKVGEDDFRMEHGFHGFFPQYYNLKSLVSELDITRNFVSLDTYAVVYKDAKYRPEVFRPSNSAFPWNIVDLGISSGNRLNWGLNLTKLAHWKVFREITGFHPERSYGRLDELSVAEWVSNDFPRGLYDLYFLPFAKSSLNAPDVLSAGELMQFFHFYFFGNPEGLAFEGTKQDMGRSLVDPIAASISNCGGRIITDVAVSSVKWDNNCIASIDVERGDRGQDVPFWVERNDLMQVASLPSDRCDFYGAGDDVYALNTNGKEALRLTCTHQGCTVQPGADGHFHCPCHGAEFDGNGKVVRGPAQRDLATFEVKQHAGDRVQLVGSSRTGSTVASNVETLTADYFVFAADVGGVKHLFSLANGEVPAALEAQVNDLAVADPFAVTRLWFDRDFEWEHSYFTSLSGYSLTDSITLYHRIQDDYIEWAKRTGGSVVELHAYCYKEKEFPTQEALLTTFKSELLEIVPELRSANLLHQELVNQKNFAGFPPGSFPNRPGTTTTASNLLFAGDWVKMPFPCGLMERAVSSGLLAANAILQQEGLQRRPVLSVMPEGVLSI